MIRGRIVLLLGVALGCASPALAQSADLPRVEAGLGLIWHGRQPLGAKTATESTGGGSTLALFSASTEVAAAPGFEGRIGVRLARRLVAEAEASYVKPELRIALSGDSEGATAVTATETLQQFTVGGGLRWFLPGGSRRFAPFVAGSGGYLRQLHSPATLVQTGRYFQAGGGVSVLLLPGRHFHTKGIGVRADVRALTRSKGVAFDGGSKTSPAAGLSAFVRF